MPRTVKAAPRSKPRARSTRAPKPPPAAAPAPPAAPLAAFFAGRRDALRVEERRNKYGTHDVVLRLEGGYDAEMGRQRADAVRGELGLLLEPGAAWGVDTSA